MGDETNLVQGGGSILIGSDLGFMKGGWTLTPTAENYYSKVDGIPGDVASRRIKSGFDLAFTLVEITLVNIKMAWDEANASAGVGPFTLDVGLDTLTHQEREIEIYAYVPGGDLFVRTITIDRAVVSAPAELKTSDEEESGLACQFHALYSVTNSRFLEFSDAVA